MKQSSVFFCNLSTVTILEVLPFLCFSLVRFTLCAFDIFGFQYKIIEQYIEYYLILNLWMTVI